MSSPEKRPVKTRILVLEEHPLLRHGVAQYLNSQRDMIVCGETDNIRDARQKIHECKPQLLLTALRLGTGADGYVMKRAPKEELLTAIREIVSGNVYVSHDVAMRAFKKSLETRSEQQQRFARPSIGIEKLSDRETHIFFLLGSGLGNSQIARSLSLSVKTIESHRENIKHKTHLSCSRDLVACARKYVEVTFVPPTNVISRNKKKVVRFPAA